VTERPRDVNLNVAAGEVCGTERFFDIPNSGLATSDVAVATMHRDAGWDIETIETSVVTLSEICREHAAGPIHFLKVDVEGAERQVLAGMDFRRYRPWIVVVEATIPMSQQTSHEVWEFILTQADYTFVYFDGLNRYYLAAEHAHLADAFSVPPNVFDDFVSNADQESHLRAAEAGLRAHQSQLKAKAAAAEAEASLAKARAAEKKQAAAESERAAAEAKRATAESERAAAEAKLGVAEQRIASAESRIEATESRLGVIEEIARVAASALEIAKEKLRDAETQAKAAADRIVATESRTAVAEAHARASHARAVSAERDAKIASIRAREAEATSRSAVAKGLQLRQRLRAMDLTLESARLELSLRQQSFDAKSAEAAQLREALTETERLLAEVHASFSVRVTAPLRFVASLVRRHPPRAITSTPAVRATEVPQTQQTTPLAGQRSTEIRDISEVVAESAHSRVTRGPSARGQATRIDAGFVVPYDPKIDAARLAATINGHIDRVD